ncbi:phage terminase large subunit family protein [Helicobacter jaachi]|uniref:Phage terminase large subunit family protein n=1 Tax=Helicobacter jaachi TaxID=1677920 RepID=A0A4U8TCG4_9HELI|nr:terminase gpA endonuclease subunit [Helicobacter jaachi]TLD97660.1 phage terminase large subunit family protein [Helicobacter jaachi]
MKLRAIFAKNIFIKPKLDLYEWSARYRILSQESSALFGRFEALSYQIEPMRAISDEKNREIILMWASQLGKSEILNNTIGYYIHQNPSTILFLLPTEDMAEDYSKRRLTPMFRDCKELGNLIYDRESNNTILIKNFKGGNLALVGSNSPSKLASKPIKVLIVDEVDRCENTKEGHSIDLAQKRTNTYYDRKIIKVSTPTIKGHSVIEAEYELSDKRKYFVPCPHCGFMQVLSFEFIKWEQKEDGTHDLDSVRYACVECGALWSEIEKNKAVNTGEWRATKEGENLKIGFHLNALYSPFFTLRDIVKDFLDSKDNPAKFQVFVNTIKAQSFEPPSVKFEDSELYNRREDYTPTTLPDDIIFITAGVDIQGDRIEIEFKGWGLGFENWGIAHIMLMGNTQQSDVWQRAYKELKNVFYTTSGRKLRSSICLIDSGYNKERVYSLVRLDSRFFATKGASESERKKEFIGASKKVEAGVRLFSIGTYEGKSEIFRLLRIKDKGAGYCHYAQSYTLEYFSQLTAEKLVKVKTASGYLTHRWEKIRERNEGLDLSVLCLAGAKLLKLDRLDIQKITQR